MMGRLALCVDAESMKCPQLIGLDDLVIDDMGWLLTFSDAAEARLSLSVASDIGEVWIVSCDGMDPINLAAGIKRDDPGKRVLLVSANSSGSFLSRLRSAGLDGVLSADALARRIADERREREFSLVGQESSSECEAEANSREVASGEPPRRVAVDDIDEKDFAFEAKPSSVILSVVSAGGGAGKSSFAAIAATIMARRGFRTVLVDGDLVGGDAAILSGDKDSLRFDDLVDLEPQGLTSECFIACESGYSTVAAPEKIEVGASLRDRLPSALARLSELFDVVIVSADSNWDERKVALLEASTHVVCLVGQRMSSIRMSQRVLSLCARCGVAETSISFALGSCGAGSLFSSLDLSCALQGRRVIELADGGRAVEELLGVGAPGSLVDEGNAFCRSVELALDELVPELASRAPSAGSDVRGFRKRLLFGRKPQVDSRKSSNVEGRGR